MSLTTQPSLIALGPASIIPAPVELQFGSSTTEVEMWSIATDGTKFVIAGRQNAGGWGVFVTTGMNFDSWTFHAQAMVTDTPKNPHIAYGNGKWVMTTYYGREAWHSTDGITWIAATTVPSGPLRIASYITYLKEKDVFYMGREHGWYSIDGGVNWLDRGLLQTFPEVGFYDWIESPPGFAGTTFLSMGQERGIYDNLSSQVMSAFTLFADGTLWPSLPNMNHIATDGVKTVAFSSSWDAALMTSPGIWNGYSLTGDSRANALLFIKYFPGEAKWYAVCQDATNPILSSDDAINWVHDATTPFEGFELFPSSLPDSYLIGGQRDPGMPANSFAVITQEALLNRVVFKL